VKHGCEREKQYEWSQKGRKYKTKYLAALGDLFGINQKAIPNTLNFTKVKRSLKDGIHGIGDDEIKL
jgi:hypothetical protein